ncbi:septum site-determining protein MinC, partial [Luteimonas sp. Y-2-2-4F]|nr:septum site-determining protein MinC [Luteimonas sp. Y-2-2-4F]
MAATNLDFEPAGELKFGQVGIANLRVRRLDPTRLAAEMRDRVARAPNLFGRAAVVIDFGGLPATPEPAEAQALIDALREAGVLPVALAWGSADNGRLAEALGLPLLSKFRAQYERGDGAADPAPPAAPEPAAAAPEPR